jgi:hypothetical protein
MAELPLDMVLDITKFLHKKDLFNLRLVSHLWKEAVSFHLPSLSFRIPKQLYKAKNNSHECLIRIDREADWSINNIKKASAPDLVIYGVLYGTFSIISVPTSFLYGFVSLKSRYFKFSLAQSCNFVYYTSLFGGLGVYKSLAFLVSPIQNTSSEVLKYFFPGHNRNLDPEWISFEPGNELGKYFVDIILPENEDEELSTNLFIDPIIMNDYFQ